MNIISLFSHKGVRIQALLPPSDDSLCRSCIMSTIQICEMWVKEMSVSSVWVKMKYNYTMKYHLAHKYPTNIWVLFEITKSNSKAFVLELGDPHDSSINNYTLNLTVIR